MSLPWRAEIADWSIPQRQLWGELANTMEANGIAFPESERLAYERCRPEVEPTTREFLNRYFKPGATRPRKLEGSKP